MAPSLLLALWLAADAAPAPAPMGLAQVKRRLTRASLSAVVERYAAASVAELPRFETEVSVEARVGEPNASLARFFDAGPASASVYQSPVRYEPNRPPQSVNLAPAGAWLWRKLRR